MYKVYLKGKRLNEITRFDFEHNKDKYFIPRNYLICRPKPLTNSVAYSLVSTTRYGLCSGSNSGLYLPIIYRNMSVMRLRP